MACIHDEYVLGSRGGLHGLGGRADDAVAAVSALPSPQSPSRDPLKYSLYDACPEKP